MKTRIEISREKTIALRIGYRNVDGSRIKWESSGRFRTNKQTCLVIEIQDTRLNNTEKEDLREYLSSKYNSVWWQKKRRSK